MLGDPRDKPCLRWCWCWWRVEGGGGCACAANTAISPAHLVTGLSPVSLWVLCIQLKSATRQAAVSTASMGKFDRLARGEKPEDRQQRGKKRKFAPVADKVRSSGRWRPVNWWLHAGSHGYLELSILVL